MARRMHWKSPATWPQLRGKMEEQVIIKLLTGIGAIGMGALFVASGCGHSSPPAESADTALAHPIATVDTHSAADSIAEARCAREDRCTNVGADKKYSSVQDCLTRVRDDWKEDLNARQCPGGTNEKQLNQCLDAIRHEDCSSPFDTLSRMSECTAGQICNEK
jgi:hypothetical protein